MRISYVLPIHNEEATLRNSVELLAGRLESFPGSEIVMVENGSRDGSPELVRRLAEELSSTSVAGIATSSAKGFGNAYREGLSRASGDLIVLSAADLPFAFSDLDSYLDLERPPGVVIGSKGHPQSLVQVKAVRRLASWTFRLLRRVLVGMDVRDSQGTILIDGDLARRLTPHLLSSDYFVSTEIIALAQTCGVKPLEVAVDYSNPRGDSTVRPVRDGLRMTGQLIELRKRLRSIIAPDVRRPRVVTAA